MNKLATKSIDIVLNIIIPLVIGTVFYFAKSGTIVRNFLPDGLWAYALTSTVLIIWNRQINIFWLCLTVCLFIAFELLQSINIVSGTGDILDIIVYFLFGLFALLSNNFFKSINLITKKE